MMNRLIIAAFSTILCLHSVAQTEDEVAEIGVTCIVLQNGTLVSTSYNNESKVLTFDIRNNLEEVEIVMVKDGVTIYNEVSALEEDNVCLNLSKYENGTIEIYVHNRRETQYVGNVVCK